MKYRLRRVGVLKAAIMGGLGYAILSLVFVPFFLFFAMLGPAVGGMGPMEGEWMLGPAFALLLPLIYGFFGFIGTALAAAVYNLIAMMVGGLDIELEQTEQDRGTAAPDSPGY